jgi:hypothetical protein
MYKMQIDVKDRLLTRFSMDDMVVPDFLEHGARRLAGHFSAIGGRVNPKRVAGEGQVDCDRRRRTH